MDDYLRILKLNLEKNFLKFYLKGLLEIIRNLSKDINNGVGRRELLQSLKKELDSLADNCEEQIRPLNIFA